MFYLDTPMNPKTCPEPQDVSGTDKGRGADGGTQRPTGHAGAGRPGGRWRATQLATGILVR